ncbi:TetR/AcrR family transcriptional regulator [Stackebrandtia nassauensis]|uniref:Transcriptional regulator, TetR family n=1 Tax=Stackebrandtia nassauensis (strain DSM 44728 / CIP 108903 / NRRL B-16338 / NBRC 102104 / LLR-40K-21) TaxID=446470 RepID=D3Q3M7_STANL|nr:TetR/AcrR family transcriptional regulator [Stackebrandtia nassauensis]ADD43944.1 transcriptional regulator, TetR family [Stackebrandtia nassauensis DSM 44728]
MSDELSLRERKKAQTRRDLIYTAIELVSAKGYDNVTVAEIAEAAQVSKMTVFNYFGSKDDLLMAAPERHVDDPTEAVRDRASGQTPVDAVREYFLAALLEQDPATGLSDNDTVRKLQRIASEVPSLRMRWASYVAEAQRRLAEYLATEDECDDLTADLVAAQIEGVRMALIRANIVRMVGGETAAEVYPEAKARAERAFALLETGLGDVLRR